MSGFVSGFGCFIALFPVHSRTQDALHVIYIVDQDGGLHKVVDVAKLEA